MIDRLRARNSITDIRNLLNCPTLIICWSLVCASELSGRRAYISNLEISKLNRPDKFLNTFTSDFLRHTFDTLHLFLPPCRDTRVYCFIELPRSIHILNKLPIQGNITWMSNEIFLKKEEETGNSTNGPLPRCHYFFLPCNYIPSPPFFFSLDHYCLIPNSLMIKSNATFDCPIHLTCCLSKNLVVVVLLNVTLDRLFVAKLQSA